MSAMCIRGDTMKRIFDTIQKYNMISPGMTVVAGVSGGADSVCMLFALAKYREQIPFSLIAVHVEHGIRGQESLNDARFTRQFCADLNVPFKMVSVRAVELAKEQGISVEEAGRNARYAIFREELHSHGDGRIAVAHHMNDQAETVLWNLVRGSGLRGLGGMQPVSDDVIRPLLFLERSSVEEILGSNGISWRTDQTNFSREYSRNKIRLSVLPQLEQELNPRTVEHISNAAKYLREAERFLHSMTVQAAGRCFVKAEQGEGIRYLDVPSLLQEDPYLQSELIREAFQRARKGMGLKDIQTVHIEQILALCKKKAGSDTLCVPGGWKVVREYERLYILSDDATRAAEQDKILMIEEPGEYFWDNWKISVEILQKEDRIDLEIVKENQYTKWLDYDKINQVCLRHRSAGDYLQINDIGGKKKVKDYLINEKVPVRIRDQLWMFTDGSHVLWIPGYRISSAVKLSEDTQNIIKIQITEVESV